MTIYLSHGADDKSAAEDIARKLRLTPSLHNEAFESSLPSVCVSGGDIAEYLHALSRSDNARAVFIPRIARLFPMPAKDRDGRKIPHEEIKPLILRHDAKPFYSPQMMLNYFIFQKNYDCISFALFDDARSISEKLRLAKRLGFKSAFLAYRSIYDIIGNIFF